MATATTQITPTPVRKATIQTQGGHLNKKEKLIQFGKSLLVKNHGKLHPVEICRLHKSDPEHSPSLWTDILPIFSSFQGFLQAIGGSPEAITFCGWQQTADIVISYALFLKHSPTENDWAYASTTWGVLPSLSKAKGKAIFNRQEYSRIISICNLPAPGQTLKIS